MHSTTDYASSNKQWRSLVLSGQCMVVSVKSGKCTKWHMWWFACFCIFPKVEISLFDCNVSIEHVKSGGIHPHAILHKMTYIMICMIHGPHVKVTVAYSHLLALEPPYFWCTITQQKVDQIVWIPLYTLDTLLYKWLWKYKVYWVNSEVKYVQVFSSLEPPQIWQINEIKDYLSHLGADQCSINPPHFCIRFTLLLVFWLCMNNHSLTGMLSNNTATTTSDEDDNLTTCQSMT